MARCEAAIALAGPLDGHLGQHHQNATGLSNDGIAILAELCAELERMADALATEQAYTADASLIERLQALTSVDMQPADEPAAESGEAESSAGPDDLAAGAEVNFDPEIAAIFAEEAVEILEQSEAAVQQLGVGADKSRPLSELQRLLHTLKGGARMAGVTAMGDLSHALETLFEGLASGRQPLSQSGLNLVRNCLDRLQQMRDSIDAGQLVGGAGALLAELESYSGAESAVSAPPAAPELAAEPLDTAEPEPAAALDAEQRPAATPTLATQPADALQAGEVADAHHIETLATPHDIDGLRAAEPLAATPAAAESRAVESATPALQPEAEAPAPAARVTAERVETARVDAELLDLLLNGAGEINIFQSRLNQQLHSIEFHLGELGQTVTRLREQLRNLEAETEAQILHRHQDDMGGDQNFDPLELDRYSTIQQLSRALAETSNDVASINELLYGLTTEADTLLTQQARVTTELQDGLMKTRMVSFQRHVSRLARIVRQAASDTGKSAELEVDGASSELDRQVLDSILPALEHLLRNAVVHGLETSELRRRAGKPEVGKVTLMLRREGAEVLIEVTDDGAGLDLDQIRRKARELRLVDEEQQLSDQEAVELILRPGFSTAGELTQTAGRGVGMDVVDNEVKKLGGSLRIESAPGEGTRFLLRLPYTLAITHALIVNVGDETFALPLPTVEGITRVRREQLLDLLTEDEPRLDYGGVGYRIQHLGSLVGSAPSALPEEDHAVSLVLIRAGESSTALLTDQLEGSREIVVKTLGPHIASVPGVSGATILGDGRIIMILDAGTLVRAHAGGPEAAQVAEVAEKQLTALVVDDSITMRRVTQRLLERRGVKVLTARDGLDAISVLQEHEADIILLDIEMPRMDGYQFASHVRNDPRLKDLPIIMITSRSGEKHRAKAIEVGVNDYLSKPYQEAQLVKAMETLLGRSL